MIKAPKFKKKTPLALKLLTPLSAETIQICEASTYAHKPMMSSSLRNTQIVFS